MKLATFSIDLVLSFLILSISLFLIYNSMQFYHIRKYHSEEIPGDPIYSKNRNPADEIMNFFVSLKVSEINITLLRNYSSEVEEDVALAEFISSLYLSGVFNKDESLKNLARELTKEILKNVSDKYCVEIRVGNESIYKNCENYSDIVYTSSFFISGLEYGKPIRGYVSRAWITKYKKITTEIIDFSVSGSGWRIANNYGGSFEYYKNFYISEDNEILNATLFVSMHLGNVRIESSALKRFEINSCDLKNEILRNLSYLQCEGFGSEVNCAIFSIVNVTRCVRVGMNSVRIELEAPESYHVHFHPGFKLSLDLKKPEEMKESKKEVRQRIYFDRVVGRTGAWVILPFFIPENSKIYNASLFLKIINLEDSRLRNVNTSDLIIFLNQKDPIYKDGNDVIGTFYPYSPNYCLSIDWRNYYCNRYIERTRNIEIFLNITNYTIRGTNTLSVYLNSFGDFHWGRDFAEISNESYIEVYYELNETYLNYGEVEITKEIFFGGKAENPKIFSFIRNSSKISNAIVHIVQGFSSMLNASINKIPFYVSPSARAVPSHIYLFSRLIKEGNNSIEIRDIQPGGTLSPTNYILPWTSLELSYIVKGLVGYGNVFETKEKAVEDAVFRLKKQVENIEILDTYVDTKEVFGIRWVFGPEVFQILVWQKA